MSGRIAYDYQDGVATITMNDGKVNILSTAMLAEIGDALDRAEQDAAIVVLQSARPGIFSAGFDLKIFAANDAQASLDMVKGGAELALRLMAFPHPTLGVMQGHAYPMGTFLLLACDLRLASAGSHRMGLNEVTIGIAPPGFAVELARSRMHPAWLSRTVALGEMFTPEAALEAGLLDRVVAPEALDTELSLILEGMKAVHRPSHALAKRRLRYPAMAAIRDAIDRELTIEAYTSGARAPSDIVLPGRPGM